MNKDFALSSIQDNLFYSYAENLISKKLSIEQLRKLDGFGQISDNDALNIIEELYKLTIITYKIYNKNGTRTI